MLHMQVWAWLQPSTAPEPVLAADAAERSEVRPPEPPSEAGGGDDEHNDETQPSTGPVPLTSTATRILAPPGSAAGMSPGKLLWLLATDQGKHQLRLEVVEDDLRLLCTLDRASLGHEELRVPGGAAMLPRGRWFKLDIDWAKSRLRGAELSVFVDGTKVLHNTALPMPSWLTDCEIPSVDSGPRLVTEIRSQWATAGPGAIAFACICQGRPDPHWDAAMSLSPAHLLRAVAAQGRNIPGHVPWLKCALWPEAAHGSEVTDPAGVIQGGHGFAPGAPCIPAAPGLALSAFGGPLALVPLLYKPRHCIADVLSGMATTLRAAGRFRNQAAAAGLPMLLAAGIAGHQDLHSAAVRSLADLVAASAPTPHLHRGLWRSTLAAPHIFAHSRNASVQWLGLAALTQAIATAPVWFAAHIASATRLLMLAEHWWHRCAAEQADGMDRRAALAALTSWVVPLLHTSTVRTGVPPPMDPLRCEACVEIRAGASESDSSAAMNSPLPVPGRFGLPSACVPSQTGSGAQGRGHDTGNSKEDKRLLARDVEALLAQACAGVVPSLRAAVLEALAAAMREECSEAVSGGSRNGMQVYHALQAAAKGSVVQMLLIVLKSQQPNDAVLAGAVAFAVAAAQCALADTQLQFSVSMKGTLSRLTSSLFGRGSSDRAPSSAASAGSSSRASPSHHRKRVSMAGTAGGSLSTAQGSGQDGGLTWVDVLAEWGALDDLASLASLACGHETYTALLAATLTPDAQAEQAASPAARGLLASTWEPWLRRARSGTQGMVVDDSDPLLTPSMLGVIMRALPSMPMRVAERCLTDLLPLTRSPGSREALVRFGTGWALGLASVAASQANSRTDESLITIVQAATVECDSTPEGEVASLPASDSESSAPRPGLYMEYTALERLKHALRTSLAWRVLWESTEMAMACSGGWRHVAALLSVREAPPPGPDHTHMVAAALLHKLLSESRSPKRLPTSSRWKDNLTALTGVLATRIATSDRLPQAAGMHSVAASPAVGSSSASVGAADSSAKLWGMQTRLELAAELLRTWLMIAHADASRLGRDLGRAEVGIPTRLPLLQSLALVSAWALGPDVQADPSHRTDVKHSLAALALDWLRRTAMSVRYTPIPAELAQAMILPSSMVVRSSSTRQDEGGNGSDQEDVLADEVEQVTPLDSKITFMCVLLWLAQQYLRHLQVAARDEAGPASDEASSTRSTHAAGGPSEVPLFTDSGTPPLPHRLAKAACALMAEVVNAAPGMRDLAVERAGRLALVLSGAWEGSSWLSDPEWTLFARTSVHRWMEVVNSCYSEVVATVAHSANSSFHASLRAGKPLPRAPPKEQVTLIQRFNYKAANISAAAASELDSAEEVAAAKLATVLQGLAHVTTAATVPENSFLSLGETALALENCGLGAVYAASQHGSGSPSSHAAVTGVVDAEGARQPALLLSPHDYSWAEYRAGPAHHAQPEAITPLRPGDVPSATGESGDARPGSAAAISEDEGEPWNTPVSHDARSLADDSSADLLATLSETLQDSSLASSTMSSSAYSASKPMRSKSGRQFAMGSPAGKGKGLARLRQGRKRELADATALDTPLFTAPQTLRITVLGEVQGSFYITRSHLVFEPDSADQGGDAASSSQWLAGWSETKRSRSNTGASSVSADDTTGTQSPAPSSGRPGDSVARSPMGVEAATAAAAHADAAHRWPLVGVVRVLPRRWCMAQCALEIFFADHTSVLLAFLGESAKAPDVTLRSPSVTSDVPSAMGGSTMDDAMSELSGSFVDLTGLSMLDDLPARDDATAAAEGVSVASKALAMIKRLRPPCLDASSAQEYASAAQKQWLEGSISNFEYLMHLNWAAGRSLHDINQYPVFPWVLADYRSEELDLTAPSSFRDLTKPIGAQTEARREVAWTVYEDAKREVAAQIAAGEPSDAQLPVFMFGSHYSRAGAVLYFLLRLQPFTLLHIQLQAGRFDVPDRLFISMDQTWQGCIASDTLELVPELYTCPEVLMNSAKLPLGVRQTGEPVSDVLLPPWAHGSPVQFIAAHRAALECPAVTASLHAWVDLVFGYKQQGVEAERAFNVYHPMTYPARADAATERLKDPAARASLALQVREFGQTPRQLFDRKHPGRVPTVHTGLIPEQPTWGASIIREQIGCLHPDLAAALGAVAGPTWVGHAHLPPSYKTKDWATGAAVLTTRTWPAPVLDVAVYNKHTALCNVAGKVGWLCQGEFNPRSANAPVRWYGQRTWTLPGHGISTRGQGAGWLGLQSIPGMARGAAWRPMSVAASTAVLCQGSAPAQYIMASTSYADGAVRWWVTSNDKLGSTEAWFPSDDGYGQPTVLAGSQTGLLAVGTSRGEVILLVGSAGVAMAASAWSSLCESACGEAPGLATQAPASAWSIERPSGSRVCVCSGVAGVFQIAAMQAGAAPITAVSLNTERGLLCTGTASGEVKLFSLSDGAVLRTARVEGPVWHVGATPLCMWAISGSNEAASVEQLSVWVRCEGSKRDVLALPDWVSAAVPLSARTLLLFTADAARTAHLVQLWPVQILRSSSEVVTGIDGLVTAACRCEIGSTQSVMVGADTGRVTLLYDPVRVMDRMRASIESISTFM